MLNKTLIVILLLSISVNVYAFRIKRPIKFTHPLTEEQIKELNNVIEDLFLMQQGRFELDVSPTSKTDAKEGEIWIYNNTLQFKSGGSVRTLTP